MNFTRIKTAVLNQILEASGLYSLTIQNHIYGCFILMEDIAQKAVDVSETIVSTAKYTFDFDKQFSEIGLRYGFIMDTKLILDTYSSEYKNTWLDYFRDISILYSIADVDVIEDNLIEILQHTLPPEDAYFLHALETGSLPQEWIQKVLQLLNPSNAVPAESDEEIVKSAVSTADIDKPLHRHKRLSKTRRAIKKELPVAVQKKSVAKTRRHH